MYNDDGCDLTETQIIHRILNEHNKPITEEFINGIFERVGFDHRIKNLQYYQQSMIHESYIFNQTTNPKTIKLLKEVQPIDPQLIDRCMPLQQHSYERLEFLGDSVLRHGIGKYLYTRFPEEDEGFLTSNRSKMENKFALSKLARKFSMHTYAVIARSVEQVNGRISYINITEDIFEAFIGAVNLEVGDDRSIDFIWKIIEYELDIAETIRTQKNYKDILMQYFHKIDVVRKDLLYEDYEVEVNGKRKFRTIVREKGTMMQLGCGSGKSKKSSQQHAARDALIKIGLLKNKNNENDEYFDIDAKYIDIDMELNKVNDQLKLSTVGNEEFFEYDEHADMELLNTLNEISKSTTAKSTTAKSATAKSTTAKSTTAKSTTAKSTTAKSTTAKSTTAKSTTAKSTTAKSTTAKSTTAGRN